jgi:RNA polymerase sigma-70 factor (ECF subfamily)
VGPRGESDEMVRARVFDASTEFFGGRKPSPRPVAWDGGDRSRLRERAPAPVLRITPSFDQLDDRALLSWVVQGDHAAWRVFHRRFRGLILSCAMKVASKSGARLGSDDLMDVLGEVSLNLVAHDYRRLRMYDDRAGCSVASWVGVIATSTTRDHLRRVRRQRLEPVPDGELERHAEPGMDPERALMESERRAFVERALSDLSSRDREFVELYFAEALSPEEIAERMSVSLSTVYSKKAKIKARLARLAAERAAEAAVV